MSLIDIQSLEMLGNRAINEIYSVRDSMNAHIRTSAIHVTSDEKQQWNSPTVDFFTYSGNDQSERILTLPRAPKAVYVFAINTTPTLTDMSSPNITLQYSAIACPNGNNMDGILLNGDKLTVYCDPPGLLMQRRRFLNVSGLTYCVIMFLK